MAVKLKALPKVLVCVSYANKGAVTKIFGSAHHAPVIREGKSPIVGELLLRDAIPAFNLSLEEIKFLR